MKRLMYVFVFSILFAATSVNGQIISENAIGIRLEEHDGVGPQFTYQRAVSDMHRFQFDLGVNSSRHYAALKGSALFHWVYNIVGGLNWYWGLGAGLGVVDSRPGYHHPDYPGEAEFFLTGEADFGIEYSFLGNGVPLQLALDINPSIQFLNSDYTYYYPNHFNIGTAFSVRYQF